MTLSLKKAVELSEADLRAHSVWVAYYEPDEFELLEEVGINAREAHQALASVEFSDEYVFPLPSAAAALPFKYHHLSARIKTPDGRELIGYRTSTCLCVMFGGKTYYFNKALVSLSQEQAAELCAVLGVSELFPLNVFLPATSTNEEFSLPTKG